MIFANYHNIISLYRRFSMKKLFLVLFATTLFCCANLFAEPMFSEPTQNTNVRYRLFPTQNTWTFLKLDTMTGKIWQVQYSVEGEDYIFETSLSLKDFAETLKLERKIGRFTLYPTRNVYNFIMLDQIDGRTYQVQWSTEPDNRAVIPILQ